jgi:phosphate transport system substrate-binding protein
MVRIVAGDCEAPIAPPLQNCDATHGRIGVAAASRAQPNVAGPHTERGTAMNRKHLPLLALGLASLAFAAPAQAAERLLRMHGSNTIGQKLAPALVRAYASARGYSRVEETRPAADELTLRLARGDDALVVEIRAHGTSTGYGDLVAGRADLWMASRPANAVEIAGARDAGALDAPRQEHVLALDGLAVIVNPRNPLATLDKAQVRALFTGRVRDWSGVGLPPGRVRVYARDDRSGTFDTFRTLVLEGEALVAGAERFESTEALSVAVATDANGIGFVGLAGVGSAKPLAISDRGTRALAPTHLTVATEDYALSRRLFLYQRDDATDVARDFVDFATGEAGQRVVEDIGFVSQDVRALVLEPRRDVSDEYLSLTRGARRLSLNFRFGSGMALLDSKALRDVDRLGQFLHRDENQGLELVLIGFADANETNPYQALSLSNERVDYVALRLVERGVGAARVRGMGHAGRVADDATPAGRQRNRRVEAWVRPARATGSTTGAHAGAAP